MGFLKNIRDVFDLNIQPELYKDILHLKHKDYRMIELMYKDNELYFINEIKRLTSLNHEILQADTWKDNADGRKKTSETLSLRISMEVITDLFAEAGMKRVSKFYKEGVGLLENDPSVTGFGSNKFAVVCEVDNGFLQHIWITGNLKKAHLKNKLCSALSRLGNNHDFIIVNWTKCKYNYLYYPDDVTDFVERGIYI